MVYPATVSEKQRGEELKEVVNNMMIYLDYREKYFRNQMVIETKAGDDKKLLSKWTSQEDTTGLKMKLEESITWWCDIKTTPFPSDLITNQSSHPLFARSLTRPAQ